MRRLGAVIALGVLSAIIASLAHASSPTSVVRDLGTMPAVGGDDRLVAALSALLRANPGDRLVAAEARFVPEGAEMCSARFLYDRDRRMLLVMLRTERRGSGDFYHLRTYPDTDPEDFRYRLPHRAQKGYPQVAQSTDKAEVPLPVAYPGFPRLSEWP